MWWVFTLLMLATPGQGTGAPTQAGSLKGWLTPEQAEKLAVKLSERKPFLDSDEARNGKHTMGLFFQESEYRLLRGNPIFGYWQAKGFLWNGTHVAWDGVASKGSRCKAITSKAWNAAMEYVFRKHGLVVDPNAPMRMRGACVWAVIDTSKDEPTRGVIMEMRLQSPTGTFLWRYSRGNPTIEGAVGASIELPILLGHKINKEGSWPRNGW